MVIEVEAKELNKVIETDSPCFYSFLSKKGKHFTRNGKNFDLRKWAKNENFQNPQITFL